VAFRTRRPYPMTLSAARVSTTIAADEHSGRHEHLLRRTQPDHSSHTLAVESVAKLLANADPVYFTLHNASEFWNVVTRPVANNGLGFSVALALGELEKIEWFLTILPDSPAVYVEWKRLVLNVHGIRRILTFNTDDFTRYDIEAVHPASLPV
jgi:hypothetical protein